MLNCTTQAKKMEPQPSTGDSGDFLSYEDLLSKLMNENSCLRQQLKHSQHKQHLSDSTLVAAKKTITKLKTQLEEGRRHRVNLENKIASLNLKLDLAKEMRKHQGASVVANKSTAQSTAAFQNQKRTISNQVQQLQKAKKDLEVCPPKLQSSADNDENGEHELHEKVQTVKKDIVDDTVKLQQEQVTVMKQAIKPSQCVSNNTEEKCPNIQTSQTEELEKVELQAQKVHLAILQQALMLKSGLQKQAPSKCPWIRAHTDQEPQTEQLVQTAERKCDRAQQDICEETVNHQMDQQLQEKVTAGELQIRILDLEAELLRRSFAMEQTEFKLSYIQQELLQVKDVARAYDSYKHQAEHLKKVNAEITAAQMKAEEQLHMEIRHRQEERKSLIKGIKELHQVLTRKEQERSKWEKDMESGLENLQSRITERMEKKSKKK